MASDQTVHSSRLSDLDFAAQFIEPTHESQDRLGAVATGEVLSAEVLVFDLVLEHMPDGGEDRSGHREDGFLRAAASLEAQKLSLQVAAFGTHGRPRGGDQRGLEPGSPFAGAGRAALAFDDLNLLVFAPRFQVLILE